jgi:CheY-like chemotaxis protein
MGKAVILVVDDEPLNIKLLRGILSDSGYAVMEAQNGREALSLSGQNPDLILLDLMMPEIDGFETCRLLKENPETREIPVIFLSALQDIKYRTFGARLGGADYITKPFDQGELLARVQTQLAIRDQQARLREYAERLQEMVEEKNRQMVHVERLTTLGVLAVAVVQEINDPLAAILAVVERVNRDLAGPQERLREVHDSQRPNPFPELIGRLSAHLEKVSRGREKLDRILSDLKELGTGAAA